MGALSKVGVKVSTPFEVLEVLEVLHIGKTVKRMKKGKGRSLFKKASLLGGLIEEAPRSPSVFPPRSSSHESQPLH